MKEKLIIVDTTDNSMFKTPFIHIKTINMYENVMPYKEIKVEYNNKLQREYFNDIFQFGNSVDYFAEDGLWRIDHKYNHPSHGYDIVVVLGIIKDNEILVYGNKTPRTTIEIEPVVAKYKGIQRGDWLLLQKIYNNPLVIHNITQSRLIFEMNQYNPKTR